MAFGATKRKSKDAAQARVDVERLMNAVVASAFDLKGGIGQPEPALLERLDRQDRIARRVLGDALVSAVAAAWRLHWQPADVRRALERNLGTSHARLGAEVMQRQLRAYRASRLPPRWQGQLDAMGSGCESLDLGDIPGGTTWVAPLHPVAEQRRDALQRAIETLAYLRTLPELPKIGPLPGESYVGPASVISQVDPVVLHRVTSLLAKAESTTFPDEAEALTAKAQQLMARHSIDMAVVEAERAGRDGSAPVVNARRVGIDDPYAGAKTILLQVIAEANRCRAIWSKPLGFSTVFGHDVDLDVVEVLYTSLLVQSTRAMIAASPPGRSGGATRSFRQSFLVSFAGRIGERLREAVADAVDEVKADAPDGVAASGLLPVLASRDAAAEAACSEAFPRVRTTRTQAKDLAGWQAGRHAADRAQLNLTEPLGSGPKSALGLARG